MVFQHNHPEFNATEPSISVGAIEGNNALLQEAEPLPTEEIAEPSSEPVVEVTEPSVEVIIPLETADPEPISPPITEPLPTEPAKPTETTLTEPKFTEAPPRKRLRQKQHLRNLIPMIRGVSLWGAGRP